ncbi:MAG: acetate--CoA ligase family protein [Dehalococcoidia bacterium]|nr:Succinate--CoA ligase (GDP-forming) subunit alpha [Chloroflexota bacterium]MBT9160175.1 Succinate--CoA ligase (GDP-forming) subunit alpha [Chloroflexota bacterium]MBT9162168.1 Succinate--CoA ligase (GDP-forming) subunit alpha [Chloroflexota bacterium]MBT9163108.1 Succinate--CoA ligase (GDP-forming) subunit alpha [Chloroflexota bacterium]
MASIVDKLELIFNPRSIAVIGASENPDKLSYHCVKSLKESGFQAIYPVNPRSSEIWGLKAYPSLREVPGEIDLAIVVVPAPAVPLAIEDCVAKGVKGIVLITAGFKEAEDPARADLQDEIASLANKSGIRVIGPNTFGFVNLSVHLNASFTPEFLATRRGHISLISQSGGVCHLLSPLLMESEKVIGFSKIVGLGNRCNIDFPDMLEYLAADPETRVILMYIEGIDDARRLTEVARRVAPEKPIVAFKTGRAATADRATYSHTGSLAGNHEVYLAALKQAGILLASDFEELLDIAKAVSLSFAPRGNRVAILSAQAGLGIVAGDSSEAEGLDLAEFSRETQEKINELLPPLSHRANPVDFGPAWYDWESSRHLVQVVMADANVDALLFLSAYASANEPTIRAVRGVLKEEIEARQKPILTCFPAPLGIWEERVKLEESGIPVYPTPERAARALRSLVQYGDIVRKK